MTTDDDDIVVYRLDPDVRQYYESRIKELEAEVERLRGRAVSCCFCGEPCGTRTALEKHSETCSLHPAVKEVERLRAGFDAAEEELRLAKQRGRQCCFCHFPCGSLAELREHGAVCPNHPLRADVEQARLVAVRLFNTARPDINEIRELVQRNPWLDSRWIDDEPIDAARAAGGER